ncbi:MAG: hypothetical protein L3J74_11950, partial [Bacteroidales bacterium]|nr:hypothetical protein [Bacteroidales bacterium]
MVTIILAFMICVVILTTIIVAKSDNPTSSYSILLYVANITIFIGCFVFACKRYNNNSNPIESTDGKKGGVFWRRNKNNNKLDNRDEKPMNTVAHLLSDPLPENRDIDVDDGAGTEGFPKNFMDWISANKTQLIQSANTNNKFDSNNLKLNMVMPSQNSIQQVERSDLFKIAQKVAARDDFDKFADDRVAKSDTRAIRMAEIRRLINNVSKTLNI